MTVNTTPSCRGCSAGFPWFLITVPPSPPPPTFLIWRFATNPSVSGPPRGGFRLPSRPSHVTTGSQDFCQPAGTRFPGFHVIPCVIPCYKSPGYANDAAHRGAPRSFFSWLHILATQPPTSGTSRLPGRWLASVPSPSDYRWAHRPPNTSVLAHCQHRLR